MSIKLTDYTKILPDSRYSHLGKREKIHLMDQVLNRTDVTKRGLLVDWDLTHSGRRINNRIYSPAGQREGVKDLLLPYAKPIIKNHSPESEPLGRFVDGHYVDLSSDAIHSFARMNDFMSLKQSFETKDWEKTAAMLHRTGVLFNDKWQGLGKIHARARITDEDAIEKFLDRRYLTFSSGATTNTMVCSECLSDWALRDICEHRPGVVYDGKPMIFLTDMYSPSEASVVIGPADNLSFVTSMEFTEVTDSVDQECLQIDDSTIYITDSIYDLTNQEDHVKPKTDDTVSETEETAEAETLAVADQKVEPIPPAVELNDGLLAKVAELIDSKLIEFAQKLQTVVEPEAPAEEALVQDTEVVPDPVVEEVVVDTTELDKYNQLNEDYTQALHQVEDLTKKLTDALTSLASSKKKTFEKVEDKNELETMLDWFATLDVESEPAKVQRVSNPSIASGESELINKVEQLGDYEKAIVEDFKNIQKESGDKIAYAWLNRQSRYLPHNFDINSYITSGE